MLLFLVVCSWEIISNFCVQFLNKLFMKAVVIYEYNIKSNELVINWKLKLMLISF